MRKVITAASGGTGLIQISNSWCRRARLASGKNVNIPPGNASM